MPSGCRILRISGAHGRCIRVCPSCFRGAHFNNGYAALFIATYSIFAATQGDLLMQKVLHIDPEKCTGCLQCEMACSFENYGVFATAKSRIKVFDFHETGKKVPYTCTQCDE